MAKLNFSGSNLRAMEGQLAKVASNAEWIRCDLVQADFARLKALSEASDDNWPM